MLRPLYEDLTLESVSFTDLDAPKCTSIDCPLRKHATIHFGTKKVSTFTLQLQK